MEIPSKHQPKKTVIRFEFDDAGEFHIEPEYRTFGRHKRVRFETRSGPFTIEFTLASPDPGFRNGPPFPRVISGNHESGGLFAAEFDLKPSGLGAARKKAARDANQRDGVTAVAFYRYEFTVTKPGGGPHRAETNGGYDPPDTGESSDI